MKQIDAILELAKSIEPGTEDWKPVFRLYNSKDDNKWRCRVTARTGLYAEDEGATPEAAVQNLYDQIVRHNQSYMSRIKKMLNKWMGRDVRVS